MLCYRCSIAGWQLAVSDFEREQRDVAGMVDVAGMTRAMYSAACTCTLLLAVTRWRKSSMRVAATISGLGRKGRKGSEGKERLVGWLSE